MAQALFSIQCETCNSRLQVRSRDAIGQIHNCPRCGSMVQIVPPPDWSPGETPAPPKETATTAAAPPEVPADDAFANDALESSLDAAQASAVPPPVPGVSPAAAEPPAPGWASPVELMTRKLVLLGAGVGIGLFALVGAIYWWSADDETTAQAPPSEMAQTDDGQDSPATDGSTQNDSAPPSADAARTENDIDSPSPPGDLPPTEQPQPGDPPPLADEPEADPGQPGDGAPADDPDSNADNVPADDPGAADNATPKDPDANAAEETTAEAVPDADALAARLERMAAAEPPAEGGGPTPAIQIDDDEDDSGLQVDVPARLADRLPQVRFAGAPLAEFASLLTRLTTVSMTLDLDALAAAGVAVDAPVEVSGTDMAVADILSAALVPLGLTYQSNEQGVVITTPAAAGSQLRAFTYPVDDLIEPTPAGLESFARLLQRVVAPESWASGGGPGKIEIVGDRLRITQTPVLHYDLVEFCEKLRVARSKPLRSKFPRARFELTSGDDLPASLERPVTFTFHQPTRLSTIREYLQQLSGMTVLVDWQALAQAGLSPRTRVTCGIADRPLAAALDDVLNPLELSWRLVDSQTIEITSQAAAAEQFERAFYDMAPMLRAGITADALTSGIRKVTAPESWSESGGPGFVYFDQPSQRLIVRQTSPIQRDIVRLIAGLRKKIATAQAPE